MNDIKFLDIEIKSQSHLDYLLNLLDYKKYVEYKEYFEDVLKDYPILCKFLVKDNILESISSKKINKFLEKELIPEQLNLTSLNFNIVLNLIFSKLRGELIVDEKKLGMKFDDNKLRWDLLPLEPIEEIIKVLMLGSAKYSDNNWKFVDNFQSRYINALYRHLGDYKKYIETGDEKYLYDKDTNLHHLAHLMCNAIFLLFKEIEKGNINNEIWKIKLEEIKEKYKKERKDFQGEK